MYMSASSEIRNACLVLVECDGCPAGAAQSLLAELRRLPSDARYFSTDFPPMLIQTKYFSVNVQTVITTAGTPSFESYLSNSAVGCVFVIGETTPHDTIPWCSAPPTCLFRVIMCYGNGHAIKDELYDACVHNKFEYVIHRNDYEVLPPGIEKRGLLGGDLCGAARLSQILHNVMWPENTHVRLGSEGTTGEEVKSNLIVVVGGGEDSEMMRRIANATEESFLDFAQQRRFVALWPPDAAKYEQNVEKQQTAKGSEPLDTLLQGSGKCSHGRMLVVASEHRASLVGFVFVHSLMFLPEMMDLFIAKHGKHSAQLAVVCWPPSQPCQKPNNKKGSDTVDSHLSLPVFIERIKFLGVNKCVVVVADSEDGGNAISSFDEHFCVGQGIEIIRNACDVNGGEHVHRLEGTIAGNKRLLEVIHEMEWPHSEALLSFDELLLSNINTNRALFWTSALTATEEESTLLKVMEDMGLITYSSPEKQHGALLPPTLRLSRSGSSSISTIVRNKYFEATVSILCYGGVRSLTNQDIPLSVEELESFGVVVVATTAQACRVDDRDRLLKTLSSCLASVVRFRGGNDLYINDPLGHETEMVQNLCASAETEQTLVLYIADGNEDDDTLVDDVENLIMQLTLPDNVSTSASSRDKRTEGDFERDDLRGDLSLHGDDSTVEDFFLPPIEVVYCSGTVSGISRLREIIEQHVWADRDMVASHVKNSGKNGADGMHSFLKTVDAKDAGETNASLSEESSGKELVEAVRFGCELPPNYLVDPLTLKSTCVEALECGNVDGKEQLVHWIDVMKRYGHQLPHAIRQRQAAMLSQKLGEELGVV